MSSNSAETSKHWWLELNGRPDGPRTTEAVVAEYRSGRITPTTRVCPVGGNEWRRLEAWPEWSLPARSPLAASPNGNLREIAVWHRRFSLGISAIIVGGLIVRGVGSAPLTAFALLATTFFQILLVVGLCRSMAMRSVVLWGVVTAVPYLGLIPLFLVSRKATARLTEAGIPVGLLGAEVPK